MVLDQCAMGSSHEGPGIFRSLELEVPTFKVVATRRSVQDLLVSQKILLDSARRSMSN